MLAQLEACLLYLRAELDPVLRERQPVKLGKPYPLGQCLEISKAVQERLAEVQESELPPAAVAGLRALRSFEREGGRIRQVWGDLRALYFQKAFQFGTLYVDVSNDTVTATKPKVEILPFDEAGLAAIRDYRHYAARAATYWQETAYPNHVLPALAPHCPLVHVGAQRSGAAGCADAARPVRTGAPGIAGQRPCGARRPGRRPPPGARRMPPGARTRRPPGRHAPRAHHP